MTDIPNMHDVKTQIDANVRAMTQKLQAQRELQETAKADWKRPASFVDSLVARRRSKKVN